MNILDNDASKDKFSKIVFDSKDSKYQAGFEIIEITEEVKIKLRISFIFVVFEW